MKKIALFLLSILSITSLASAQELAEVRVPSWQVSGTFQGTRAIRDITYKVADGQVLQFDIAFPNEDASKEGYPLIVYYHGGAWMGGSRFGGYGMFPGEVQFYTSKGIAVATVSYRFVNDWRTIEDCVIDAKDAIRFMVKNAKSLKINPKKIGVYGHSAGGHLAMMVALADNSKFVGDKNLKDVDFKIACAVPQSGPSSFVDKEANFDGAKILPEHKKFFGGKGEDKIEYQAELVSPAKYVRRNSPPMLIFNGENDEIVSQNAALFMGELAKKSGAPFEVYILPNARHSYEGGDHGGLEVKRRAFFLKHLK